MKNKKKNQTQKQSRAFSSYAVYSSIAFQMIAIIGVGTYIGSLLDNYFESEKPIITAGLSLVSVLIAIFVVIRRLLSNSKKDNQ